MLNARAAQNPWTVNPSTQSLASCAQLLDAFPHNLMVMRAGLVWCPIAKDATTSMIDVSDGLASEVMHLGIASKVGFKVYEDKLPIDPKVYETAREFNLDPTLCMLSGGEDYELLFTVRQSEYDKVRNHPKLSVIGHAVAAPDAFTLVTKNGPEVPLKAQGWDSFHPANKTN
jgi:thiamine monophosphate kinase